MTPAPVRRRAAVRLGILAALLVLAGALPWLTGAPLAIRLIALPLLLAGGLMCVATARLPEAVSPPDEAARPCATCSCGTTGGCPLGSGP